MIFIIKFSLFLIIFVLSVKVKAEVKEETIRILMKKPDIVNLNTKENYSTLFNDFLNNNYSKKNNYNVKIVVDYYTPNCNAHYDVYNVNNSGYGDFLYHVIKYLKENTYDMFIMDDEFLFSDVSLVKNYYISRYFDFEENYLYKYYLELSDFINEETLAKNYDRDMLEKGYVLEDDNKILYGLPFELDFDVLYYYEKEIDLKKYYWENQPDWENILTSEFSSSLELGLGDAESLMNYFIEYVANLYDTPNGDLFKKKKTEYETIHPNNELNYFDIFYKTSSDDNLYLPFKNHTHHYLGNDAIQKMNTTLSKAFETFSKKEKFIFKGKASYYSFKPPDTSIISLPKNYTVFNEKFLVINKNSGVKKEILIDTALALTSGEMQLHKAKVLNTIPAFNIKKEYRNSKDGDGDAVILSYCQEHQVICDLMKTLNPIWMTEMFYKNKFSAPFWEARLLLPNEIRKFILGKRDLKPIFSHILDAKVINSESNDIY
eukprot:jgi/Orpsp1_1/1192447/evm.model.d7180000093317.1